MSDDNMLDNRYGGSNNADAESRLNYADLIGGEQSPAGSINYNMLGYSNNNNNMMGYRNMMAYGGGQNKLEPRGWATILPIGQAAAGQTLAWAAGQRRLPADIPTTGITARRAACRLTAVLVTAVPVGEAFRDTAEFPASAAWPTTCRR